MLLVHKDYNANPLSPKRRLWELELIQYCFRGKRVSNKSMYFRIRRKRGYKYHNPCRQYIISSDDKKFWGKFRW